MTSLGLRADTGSFDRFLTSLGLLMLGAAVVIPYFFFGSIDTLDIRAEDLRRMTATGKEVLEGRQQGIASLEPLVIGMAAFLAVLGASLVVIGAIRLKAAQKSDEEEAQLRKDRARLEIKGLSPQERAERVVAKAQEDVPAQTASHGPPSERAQTRARPSTAVPGRGAVAYPTRKERQEAVRRIEQRIEDVFKEASEEDHRLRLQVKIKSTGDAVQMDGVFESKDDRQPDVVLKTTIAFAPTVLPKIARGVANELVAQLSRYQRLTDRTADGWLVAVVPKESEGDSEAEGRAESEKALGVALASFGKATVISEAELDILPRLFSGNFGHTYLF